MGKISYLLTIQTKTFPIHCHIGDDYFIVPLFVYRGVKHGTLIQGTVYPAYHLKQRSEIIYLLSIWLIFCTHNLTVCLYQNFLYLNFPTMIIYGAEDVFAAMAIFLYLTQCFSSNCISVLK